MEEGFEGVGWDGFATDGIACVGSGEDGLVRIADWDGAAPVGVGDFEAGLDSEEELEDLTLSIAGREFAVVVFVVADGTVVVVDGEGEDGGDEEGKCQS